MDLTRLNSAQYEAVVYGHTPLLVLAGAGTGKTTVITFRIANLIEQHAVLPERVLAVTFTNKAAREMRERTGALIGIDPRGLDIGTFHGICGRVLRRYGYRLGLDPSFLIYDQDDQLALIKQCLAALNLDSKVFSPQAMRYIIEQWKNKGETPKQANVSVFDLMQQKALEVYQLYEDELKRANAVDFGDLLLHVVTLLKDDKEVRLALQARWSHILVDEYQDTNHVQYLLLENLVTPNHSLTVVGDDDQSIYRWRGADIGNILRFERDFPGAQIVRLERNYRSTKRILAAANAVIAHNIARKGKTLYTDSSEGEKIQLKMYASERDEGEGVAIGIEQAINAGCTPCNIAVLYRTNSQSRPLEDALRRRRIPYAVFGGIRFYDRREIKDALAYMRLLANPNSDVDFIRALGAPARGVGKTSLNKLISLAREQGCSLFAAAQIATSDNGGISGRAKLGLGQFINMILALRDGEPLPLGRLVERLLRDSGYIEALKKEPGPDVQDRIDNLVELVAAIDEYASLNLDASLPGFLEEVALASDIDTLRESDNAVALMTLHSAKGLEFDNVFLTGMEDGLFPHSRCASEKAALEEERRLCYVGLTRARKRIQLSAARMRTVFGEPRFAELSRFVGEIPDEILDIDYNPAARTNQASFSSSYMNGFTNRNDDLAQPALVADEICCDPCYKEEDDDIEYEVKKQLPAHTTIIVNKSNSGFIKGTKVYHASFGEGRVIAADGQGAKQKLTIDFTSVGRKVVVARFVDRC
ncbi:MAG: UvrD-helicase domain-containing protein [Deltaproteobacteria bacterium]|nr:UvrD-helicase domain-containing protein [Deltaproteobacteria bacterium]